MTEFLSLQERLAVVSGGSRGIGRAIALELARRGAKVVVNYHQSSPAAESLVNEILAAGGQAAAFRADVSLAAEAQALVKFAIDTFGDLHILVNNAGITRDMLIMMMSEEDWQAVQDTNLKATFLCAKAAVKHMMRKRYGRIINISSVAGQMGNPGQTNYSASKAGIIGFTKALAKELGAFNINVNAVAPGLIETPMLTQSEARDKIVDMAMAEIVLKRVGTPEDLANAVVFLASEKARHITGEVIKVDGGQYI